MERAFLLLGSNKGERKNFLDNARMRIHLLAGRIVAVSAVYETKPWGKTDQPDYLNQVVELETGLSPGILLATTKAIENSLGRVRAGKWEPRTMDIDIILYGDQVINEPDLQIPHPAMAERRFVLAPLAEIANEAVHPILQKTIGMLLTECQDMLTVEKSGN